MTIGEMIYWSIKVNIFVGTITATIVGGFYAIVFKLPIL